MLMDRDQFVYSELNSIAESIVWNRAPLSRVRVKTPLGDYVEKVISKNDELVRINRDYTSRYVGSHGVKARRPSIAEAWSRNQMIQGSQELRRYVDWSKTDSYQVEGQVISRRSPERDAELVNRLVSVWKNRVRPFVESGNTAGIWGIDVRQPLPDDVSLFPRSGW